MHSEEASNLILSDMKNINTQNKIESSFINKLETNSSCIQQRLQLETQIKWN